MKRHSLTAVLPALNESATIFKIVSEVRILADVVVVDDGSTDGTGELAKEAGANVVTHSNNLGYDKALESGLLWAAAQGYQYAVTCDADGQHCAETIALFMRELEKGAELVVGVRDRTQRWSEKLFCLISTKLWNIQDPLCGMKGYRLDLVDSVDCINTYTSIGTELCIRAARSGCCIRQVNVPTTERVGASRFGSGLRANALILSAIWFGVVRALPFTAK